jgi:hypothetical protein
MSHLGMSASDVPDIITSVAAAAVTDEQLVANFDPPRMLGVHPDGWQHSDSAVVGHVLVPAFHRFREFVTDAPHTGDALVM